jgi:hypothetical protein
MALLSTQHYTAETQPEADGWFAELDRQLAALKAGTENPDWFAVMAPQPDPQGLSMAHSTTTANGYIYCKTDISD